MPRPDSSLPPQMPGQAAKSAEADWSSGVKSDTRRLMRAGVAGIAVFGVSFCVWAGMAPLAGAAVAPGFVAAAGRNQHIQHLEGGIIDQILVREGETVKAGQILFRLDGTAALAQRNRLKSQVNALRARAQRLIAERDGLDALIFDPELTAAAEASQQKDLLDEQEKEFTSRLARHRQERVIYQQRVNALGEQIKGIEGQAEALNRQLEVVNDETTRKRQLLSKGLTDRSEYTALLRSEAELVGNLGEAKSSVLSSRTQIVEAQQELARLETQRTETAATQLNDVRSDIGSVEEQLRAAEAVLARIEVRAPSDGIVVRLLFNSRGSVVKPGEAILELLPTDDDLVIEARVSPKDADIVYVGQAATLRFSAFNSRTTPAVPATVTYMSADRLIDAQSQQAYYIARMRIGDALPSNVQRRQIYPGMPVETYIGTGERTFFEYLTKPIADSFNRAFREE